MTADETTRQVSLTDRELVLLDGRVSPDVQRVVDMAKASLTLRASGLSAADAAFVASVAGEARERGRLVHWARDIRSCRICGKAAPSVTHGRNGRRLRTPRGGVMRGVELAHRFVTMDNHVTLGGCVECVGRLTPAIREALWDVHAELPPSLMGEPERWRRHDNCRCTECGWEGHEGEMVRLPTLMGDGSYPGKCPVCGAENSIFGRTLVERRDGFTVVPA